MEQNTHELFAREEQVVVGSDRAFGWVMAAALALVTLFNAWHSGRLWPWTLLLAAVFAVTAAIRPAALHPLNRAWTKLGLLLHKIANPILMGLIFYGTILPTGLVMRWRGKDALRLKRDESAESYWIHRTPGPAPETMRDQF
ncbi:hypothetical protein [Bradyrhizobium iriomotense]|uniref:hypothetical protein n=1 Tax=Bradyrhizobium iriomotense TaxID=441950 RepID=UPI001B8A190D|nr:hypothetical protein [Bradyrhizobium iriomotense]MBR0781088.1 hypothetical protein [Bradyrhizobium iriomotense]